MRVAHVLAAAVLGAGLGVQIFLSFLAAPAAFRLIDRAMAVRLMEGLFPSYYRFGLLTTGLALVLAVLLALRERSQPLRWGVVLLLAVTLGGRLPSSSNAREIRRSTRPRSSPKTLAEMLIVLCML